MDAKPPPTQDEIATELQSIPLMALVTLFSRAIESRSPAPIIRDERAVEISERLRPYLAASPDRLRRALAKDGLAPVIYRHIALRSWYYDQVAGAFMHQNPGCMVVDLGCGLDTRFARIDDGQVRFFDLDLPGLIAFKRRFVEQNQRYQMIPHSIDDQRWMSLLGQPAPRPALFLAEGVFIYLEQEQVKRLVRTLQERFAGCELLCEVFNRRWLSPPFAPLAGWFLRRVTGLGRHTDYRFGLRDDAEMESWGAGIELLGSWTYFDPRHPKLRWLRVFGARGLFRKVLWSVYYRLNAV